MFGIGSTELLVILLVALIALGPKSLASVSRSLGKAFGEFRRVSTDFQRALNAEAAREDVKREAESRKQQNSETGGSTSQAGKEQSAGAFASGQDGAQGQPIANWREAGENGKAEKPSDDSPLAQALARAKAEAATFEAQAKNAAGNAESMTGTGRPQDLEGQPQQGGQRNVV